jgi:hypothetical protein
MAETDRLQPIAPAAVRYIKLGPGGGFFERCVEDGILEFGHSAVPHELALTLDRDAIEARLVGEGRSPAKAKDFSREVADFYGLGADCLWITIGAGRLWWAFAEPEVIPIEPTRGRGARFRRVIGAWRDTDVAGRTLSLETLSTRLTKVAAYRQTVCRVEAEAYLLRRINAVEEPLVVEAQAARAKLTASARALIEMLDWRDFELLVDLIFANGGWRRASGVGSSDQADTDLVLEQPVSGERAFVQVKSTASAGTLADYVERFRASSGFDRLFFVCHSPSAKLASSSSDVHVWLGDRLAEQAVRAGLFDWLVEKAR